MRTSRMIRTLVPTLGWANVYECVVHAEIDLGPLVAAQGSLSGGFGSD